MTVAGFFRVLVAAADPVAGHWSGYRYAIAIFAGAYRWIDRNIFYPRSGRSSGTAGDRPGCGRTTRRQDARVERRLARLRVGDKVSPPHWSTAILVIRYLLTGPRVFAAG